MPAETSPEPRRRAGAWRDGRWILSGLLVVQLAVFFQFSPRYDYVQVARRWGVLAIPPNFSDLVFIAAAGATLRAGGDPYQLNAFDPMKRPYNYPPLWLHLSWHTTVSPAVIAWLAVAMGAFALASFLWFLGPLSAGRGLLLGLLACSPPVLLAAQRANADLLMLGLVALGLGLLRRGHAVGYAGLVAATWLKLYPLFTLAVLWREPRARRWRVGSVVALAGLAAFAAYAGYLGRIFANTPTGGLHSYGARVAAFWAEFFLAGQGWAVDLTLLGRCCTLLAVAVAALALRLSLSPRGPESTSLDAGELDGFRAGAAVYVTTFLFSVSFDYRLLFLLLCVPLLCSLAASRTPGRGWGIAGLILIFGLMWPNGLFWKPLLLVKEAASWGLFFTLSYLLLRTFRNRNSKIENLSSSVPRSSRSSSRRPGSRRGSHPGSDTCR
jgi:hypothetical protein